MTWCSRLLILADAYLHSLTHDRLCSLILFPHLSISFTSIQLTILSHTQRTHRHLIIYGLSFLFSLPDPPTVPFAHISHSLTNTPSYSHWLTRTHSFILVLSCFSPGLFSVMHIECGGVHHATKSKINTDTHLLSLTLLQRTLLQALHASGVVSSTWRSTGPDVHYFTFVSIPTVVVVQVSKDEAAEEEEVLG